LSTESAKTRKIFDGRYEIVSIVGRGAASVVYHGRRATAPYADVGIKVLTDKGATVPAKERLRKEALAMLYARHRYVIRLDDFRSVGDLCYLSMEYAPHKDLRHYVSERGAECTAAQRERYFSQAAEALGYIHRAGLIHRDIKPDNILVMNEAEIRVADFGVAVLPSDEASLSDLQRGVGTMEYLAPEVLDGVRCDQRSDVYSLGVTFYELLAGVHPFSQAPLAEQLEVRKDGAFSDLSQVAPQVPDYINTAIMRSLSYDPSVRFENGQQLFESLLLGRDKSKRKMKNRARPGLSSKLNEISQPQLEFEADPLAVNDLNEEAGSSVAASTPMQSSVADLVSVGELAISDSGGEEMLAERDVSRETVLIPKEAVAAARGDIATESNSESNVAVGPKNRMPQSTKIDAMVAESSNREKSNPTLASPTQSMAVVSGETSTKFRALSSSPIKDSNTQNNLRDSAYKSVDSEDRNFQKFQDSRNSGGLRRSGRDILSSVRDDRGETSKNFFTQLLEKLQALKTAPIFEQLAQRAEELQADPRAKKYLPFAAVLGAFLLGLWLFSGNSRSADKLDSSLAANNKASVITGSGIAGALDSKARIQALNFPKLEPGRYEGRVDGLIPGTTSPLAFIVPSDASSVITLVGIDGWSPVLGRYPGGAGLDKLRVSSNGFLIDFTGQVDGDSIVGFFHDLSTGAQGRWEARVAR